MINLKIGAAIVTTVAVALAVPASAQIVGALGGNPVAFIQNFARATLVAGGATGTIAGSVKAYQIWSGTRNPYEAVKYLVIGLMCLFGTAAVVGFS
jgi:hypothetical protein